MKSNIQINGNNCLRNDFEVVARFYDLSPETRAAAWASARQDPVHAADCYRAIVALLPAVEARVTIIPTTLPAMREYVPAAYGRIVA